jgi:hypothetical protein
MRIRRTVYFVRRAVDAVVDGEARTFAGRQSLFTARIPHQIMNPGNRPVRYMQIGTPSVFERFLASGHDSESEGVVPRPRRYRTPRSGRPRFGITLQPMARTEENWPRP